MTDTFLYMLGSIAWSMVWLVVGYILTTLAIILGGHQ